MLTVILTIALYLITSSIIRSDKFEPITTPVTYGKPTKNFHKMSYNELRASCKVQGIKCGTIEYMIEELYSYTA